MANEFICACSICDYESQEPDFAIICPECGVLTEDEPPTYFECRHGHPYEDEDLDLYRKGKDRECNYRCCV